MININPKKRFIAMMVTIILLITSCDTLKSPFSYEEKVFANDDYTNFFPSLPSLEAQDEVHIFDATTSSQIELLPLISLQGIISKTKPSLFLQMDSPSRIWINDLKDWYKINVNEDYINDRVGLITRFLDEIPEKKYILCDTNSVNVAMSLAGVTGHLVFDQNDSDLAKSLGLTQSIDSRGKDQDWLMGQYGNDFSNKLVMIQSDVEFGGRDLAIAHEALQISGDSEKKLPGSLEEGAPVLGTLPKESKSAWLSRVSQNGSIFIQSENAYNLSVLSSAHARNVSQHHRTYTVPDSVVHYICFTTTGGEDLGHLTSDFMSNSSHYSNSSRGKVDMAWPISASVLDLSSTVIKYYYDKASLESYRDVFVCGASGGGMFFPSLSLNLGDHISKLQKALELSSLNIISIEDIVDNLSDLSVFDQYTSLDEVDGIFYTDHSELDHFSGEIVWSNNKPVVSARFTINESIDEEIVMENLMDMDGKAYSPKGYSLIVLNHDYRTISLAEEIMDNLNPKKFASVPPDVFIELIKNNIDH